MTKQKLLNEIFTLGVTAAVFAVAGPDMAWAQNTVGDSISGIYDDMADAANVVSGIAYVAGGALGISGIMKLKAHAENPAQEKLAPGIARLLGGGGLAILPHLIGFMKNTGRVGNTGVTYNALGVIQ